MLGLLRICSSATRGQHAPTPTLTLEQIPSTIPSMDERGGIVMAEARSENGQEIWRKFSRKHWPMLVLVAAGIILGSAGAILVSVWFVGDAQSTGLVPRILGLWTMGHLVTFLLRLILWEALFVGIPTILAAVAVWRWWNKLPVEEKTEYHFFDKRSRATRGGDQYRYSC